MSHARLLNPFVVKQLAQKWLNEDAPSLDVGGAVVGRQACVAALNCKQPCTLAGQPFVDAIFGLLGCSVEWSTGEGSRVTAPRVVAHVRGEAQSVLLGERTALNVMARTSGVATTTSRFVDSARRSAWLGCVAATRKTTPGFRLPEKYAVVVAGGDTHRYDLASMVMLKDNHINACGGDIAQAVSKAKRLVGFSQKIEVEARDEQEALCAAQNGADIVMLDNFCSKDAKHTASLLKATHPRVTIEVSGGITLENFADFCCEQVDIISTSQLTQGYCTIDLSLKISG